MTRRVRAGCGSHVHATWESQPLVRSADRPQRPASIRLIAIAFVAGLLLGLWL